MLAGALELDRYRDRAESFMSAIDREHYLHFSGQKDDYEIEAIYEAHADLFSRDAVAGLRERGNRELLQFAVQGLIGQETKAEQAELARREASLEVDVDGQTMPFRQSAVAQAQEPDPERRALIERVRLDATERELNPLHVAAHERSAAIARELGWASVLELCEDLSGIDLAALEEQTEACSEQTDGGYESIVEPELERHLGMGFDQLRRSDLPAFFRAQDLDVSFPADRLIGALRTTLDGLGIDLDSQGNVVLDAEERPTKDPRAFCSPVRVPEEIYLVISPIGGRDDYEALLHEAGHTEHFAHVEPGMPFERRFLGDNSFTEAFAFLFQYLVENPAWLEDVLGTDAGAAADYGVATDLIFHRRYAAKLAYERRLFAADARLDDMPDVYARRLSEAVHVDWPRESWISDVDPFFYSASYLRAWAVERSLRGELENRFGQRWFAEREAGDMLREIWRKGQRARAEELLEELGAPPVVDFGVLVPA
jgi:hypothetical protein